MRKTSIIRLRKPRLTGPQDTPWAVSPTDAVWGAALGEYATGVGEANVVYSGITYGVSLALCKVGVIQ